MGVTIKNVSGNVLYIAEGAGSLRGAVQEAVARRAYLQGADLRGADGLNPSAVQPLLMLLDQVGKIRAYKLVTADGKSPITGHPPLTYKLGASVGVENANTDVNVGCGAGVNVATLDWTIKNWRHGNRILLVEFTKADIAAIPTASDGKFRLHRCRVVREVDLGKVGLAPEATT